MKTLVRALGKPALSLLVVAGSLAVFTLPPTDTFPPPPAWERGDVSGLLLELFAKGDEAPRDAKSVRLPALSVQDGGQASPWMPPGPVRARWTGTLHLDIRTQVRFTAEGRGRVSLRVLDRVVFEGSGDDLTKVASEQVRIRKGANKFVLDYESPAQGPAELRLLWEGRDFVSEPVPPRVFTHSSEDALLERQEPLRRGRTVFAEHRCHRCHRDATDALEKTGMPELAADAPSFEGIGSRLEPAWIAEWLTDPKGLRPQATMPKLLHIGAQDPKQVSARAQDLAAWLATLQDASANKARPPEERAQEGGVLFARLGCVGCHLIPGVPPSPDHPDRIPLERVGQKFRPGALAAFLADPARHYRWTRMPHFRLTTDEATRLAAFLLVRGAATAPSSAKGDAERGRALARELGCASCHSGTDLERRDMPSLRDIATVDWKRQGCVAPPDIARTRTPDLGLTENDRRAVLTLGPNPVPVLQGRSVDEFAERQRISLRCDVCHVLDGQGNRWSLLVTETASLDEPIKHGRRAGEKEVSQERPELTWIGEKLHTSWLEQVLSGSLPEPVRPWLLARMPSFSSRAALMAQGLSQSHGYSTSTPSVPRVDPETAKIGAHLMSAEGFGCTACHGILDQSPYATFEFGAVNFRYTYRRLRPSYFTRWMWNPRRVHATSRMPLYASLEDGLTQEEDYFEGRAALQFAAMWDYIATLH